MSVNRNSLLYSISICRHPRYSTTNCGEQTMALYRHLTVLLFSGNGVRFDGSEQKWMCCVLIRFRPVATEQNGRTDKAHTGMCYNQTKREYRKWEVPMQWHRCRIRPSITLLPVSINSLRQGTTFGRKLINSIFLSLKVKGKVHPRTGHKGPEGE
jgi:hypothetical protein